MGKERNFKKRILALILAFMMVFTMIPAVAWADVDSDITGATQVLQNEEQVNITLYGHNAFFSSMKLYKWSDTGKQGEDLLAATERANDRYALSVDEGTYLIEGYKNNGETPEKLGSIVFDVTKDGNHDFELYAVTGIKADNSGWVLNEDYTMSVKILAQDSTEKTFEMGEVNQYGVVKSCIALKGDTVTATFTPDGSIHPDFMEATASATLTSNRSGLSASCQQVVTVAFTAPENSVISVGTLSSYYVYNFAEPVSTPTASGDKVEAVYKLAKDKDYFYRVQNPNGVTYWNYARWNESSSVDITAADLYIDSSEFNKTTVFHNFEKNVYDRADIYLNINQAGYLNMNKGDTYELNSFRNWFAIESYMNAKVALPDMHYEVVGLDGMSSDVVTITPDEKNSNVAVMKANKTGTAIVMVTYDAMTHMQGMSKAAVTGGESTKQFSAIWPECTGVFVVSVEKDGTAIKTNMQLDRFGSPSTFDAEHDILFYTGNEGASFSFTPESGCTVSVARSTVNSKMSFNGFTTEGITTSESGEVTVNRLTTGRHIIKVEKNGVSSYQVVTARKVSYEVLDEEGNKLSETRKVKAGDNIKLQFSGLVNPQEKLSGVYNFNASLYYQGEDETFFRSNPGGPFGVYDFSGNPARQIIEITIPKYWAGDSYTLNGSIKMGGFAGIPTHRMVTYAKGAQKGFDAPAASSVLGQLPEITIALGETEFIQAKLNFKDNEGKTVDRSKLNISLVDGDNNKIIVAEDGSFKCLAEEYSYTINAAGYEYKTGTVNVTSEDTSFDIILNKTSENAWDGAAKTEPNKDTEDIYLISSGAEMAWFAENASKTNGIKAKLTADIDLAKYPWKAGDINNGKSEFDGAGHKVYNLKSDNGLFGTVGGGSVIKNLTLEGEILSSKGSIGGIAKYLQAGTIENCVNKANITITGNNNNTIGGIAGYAGYAEGSIKNCINKGNIAAEGSNVGGILGDTVGDKGKIEGCINEGTVTGSSNVGGIIGEDTYGIEIKNCYNTGAATGTANTGGFIGKTSKTTITSCYNAGTVSGGKGFAGTASKSSFEKCYYLGNEAQDDNAEALSAQDLKSADLGEGFKLVCNGYPALSWEIGKTEHVGTKKETVAVTCYTKGYDLYECSICHETYKTNYVASSGHTSTPEKEKVYAAYKDETCSVCGENYRIWNDDRLQYIVLPAKGVTTITMNDEGDYSWNWKTSKARFESSNGGVSRSKSKTELSFTLSEEKVLSFGYGVSSEEKYDKATIILSKTDGEPEIIADGISGINSGNFSKLLAAGEYTLSLAFAKDSSGDNNDDLGYITNVKLSDKTETPQTPEAKPSVTFRLIGCEKAKQDVDLGTDKYLPNYVTWIATTTYTLEEIGEDATVGTVFKKALDKAGLEYEGFENNYISSIKAPSGYVLAEMTNGPKSGWMYTVNGTHPDKGLNEWKIKEGDIIIWHYVNDYSYEVQDWVNDENHPALGNASTWNGWLKAADSVGGSGGGAASAPVENQSQVTTSGTSGSAATTAPTEVTVSGSTATATVKSENAAEAIKQAKENKSAEIVLNVAASDTKGAETVKVQLDTATVKSIVSDTSASLTVKTENGQVSLDREALTTVASEAKGATITLEVVTVSKPTEAQQKAAGTNGYIIRLVIKSGDKIISDFNKGKATVTVEIPAKLQDKKVAAIYIAEDGKIEQLEGKTVKIDGKKYYTFETPHFSAFALVDAEELGLEANDEEANIERIKGLVSDMSLDARSSKTSKKSIKVTLSVDKSTAAAIKEIEEMGYTVKYKYYRSTKKAYKYQAKITKTTKSYTNTAGKKGTRYYYKARIQVYDKDGKLVAQTALKQCKYAVRMWTK